MATSVWAKAQKVTAKTLDLLLTFGAGVMLDPSVSKFIGTHQGVLTAVTLALGLLRVADKTLGGKAAADTKAPTGPTV